MCHMCRQEIVLQQCTAVWTGDFCSIQTVLNCWQDWVKGILIIFYFMKLTAKVLIKDMIILYTLVWGSSKTLPHLMRTLAPPKPPPWGPPPPLLPPTPSADATWRLWPQASWVPPASVPCQSGGLPRVPDPGWPQHGLQIIQLVAVVTSYFNFTTLQIIPTKSKRFCSSWIFFVFVLQGKQIKQ